MTDEDTYNGWVNRATWMANLHLSNDRDTYDACLEMVEQADYDVRKVADYFESWTISLLEFLPFEDPMVQDFLSVGTENIVWEEIARHWVADAEENNR